MEYSINFLEWDSDFFGFPIASIYAKDLSKNLFEQLKRKALDKKLRLLYLFVDPFDKITISTLQDNNVFLADDKVTYEINISKEYLSEPDANIVSLERNMQFDAHQLENLAYQSGEYSRFKIDPLFQREHFSSLYNTWLQKSVSRQIAKEVYIYKVDGIIVGFITGNIKADNSGDIGLLAVDSSYRGKKIGQSLINAILWYFKHQEVERVTVTTQQTNLAACLFYEKCGFQKFNQIKIYHYWNNTL